MGDSSGDPFAAPVIAWRGSGTSRSDWRYTPDLGEQVAEAFANAPAGGLWAIHAAQPALFPPPRVIRAWCRQFPAFGLLMRDAEAVRAEMLREQTVMIADTAGAPAPRLALMIATRQRLADQLAPPASGASLQPGPRAEDQPTALGVTDDTLASIALAGREGEPVGGTGGAPR